MRKITLLLSLLLASLLLYSCDDLIEPFSDEEEINKTEKDEPDPRLIFKIPRSYYIGTEPEDTPEGKSQNFVEKVLDDISEKEKDNPNFLKELVERQPISIPNTPKYLTPEEEKKVVQSIKGDYDLDIVCIPAGAGSVAIPYMGLKDGNQVTVSAMPNTGYVFEGWYTDDGKNSLTDENSYRFTGKKGENVKLIAKFKNDEIRVIAHKYTAEDGGGDYYYYRMEATEEVKRDLTFDLRTAYILNYITGKYEKTHTHESFLFRIPKGKKHSNHVRCFYKSDRAITETFIGNLFPINFKDDYHGKLFFGKKIVFQLGLVHHNIKLDYISQYELDVNTPAVVVDTSNW